MLIPVRHMLHLFCLWSYRLDVSWWLQISMHVDYGGSVPGRRLQYTTVSREGEYLLIWTETFYWTNTYVQCLVSSTVFFLGFLSLVAFYPFPVFWGTCVCAGVSAQRSGLSDDAAEIPQCRPTSKSHVPHHHGLLTGETTSELDIYLETGSFK